MLNKSYELGLTGFIKFIFNILYFETNEKIKKNSQRKSLKHNMLRINISALTTELNELHELLSFYKIFKYVINRCSFFMKKILSLSLFWVKAQDKINKLK